MPRAKRKSDELYNQRRRAQRLVVRLEKQMKTQSALERASTAGYVRELREMISRSYMPKLRTPTNDMAIALGNAAYDIGTRLDRMTRPYRQPKQSAKQRSNELFVRQMRIAAAGGTSSIRGMHREEINIFYAATKDLWYGSGRDPKKKNDYIMQAEFIPTEDGGMRKPKSLAEAYRYVMKINAEAREAAKKFRLRNGMVGDTRTEMSTESDSDMDYPEYMYLVVWL